MRRHRWNIPSAIFAVAVIVAAWLALAGSGGREPSSKLKATPTPNPALASNPLQIEAIRSRVFGGDAISTVQQLGDQGGYIDTIIRYSSEGLVEYARVSTPAGTAPAAGWPVVILLHGYVDPATWRTDGTDYASLMGALAKAGYMVVRPDYRGHGLSQGQPEGGHFSAGYTYDVLNLISSLKQYPGIDGSRIGLLGHSMGGHVALRTIVASKDVKATAFMAGVVGSMSDIFYNWPNSPAPRDQPAALVQSERQKLIAQYGEPKSNPAFWDSVSAINYVTYVTGAVQINQDQADSVVPALFADHLNAALLAAGKPVEYRRYPGDDHQFTANRAAFLANLLAFYRAHL